MGLYTPAGFGAGGSCNFISATRTSAVIGGPLVNAWKKIVESANLIPGRHSTRIPS
jgi:hypothetical protein